MPTRVWTCRTPIARRIHTVSATFLILEVAVPSGYPHLRSTRRALFDLVCLGVPLERAARDMGVSTTAAGLWWRQAGAMPLHRGRNSQDTHGLIEPGDPDRPGGRGHRLNLDERIAIMRGLDAGLSDAEIGRQIGRDRSVV